jgi:predicted Rossmann fold nucleotide-binding protein DprA/Smf involved in DNA uptake
LEALGIAPAAKKGIAIADSADEQKIMDTLADGALDIDEIILAAKLPAKTVMSLLPLMEMKGFVQDLGNRMYALKN